MVGSQYIQRKIPFQLELTTTTLTLFSALKRLLFYTLWHFFGTLNLLIELKPRSFLASNCKIMKIKLFASLSTLENFSKGSLIHVTIDEKSV